MRRLALLLLLTCLALPARADWVSDILSRGGTASTVGDTNRIMIDQSGTTRLMPRSLFLQGYLTQTAGDARYSLIHLHPYEPSLGNPAGSRYFLTSTTGGARSWSQIAWGDIQSIPATFSPTVHNNAAHSEPYLTASDIAGKEDALTCEIGEIKKWGVSGWECAADSGTGGGAVDSVNGQTGVVVLDADDIAETATREFVTPAQKALIDTALQTETDPIAGAALATHESEHPAPTNRDTRNEAAQTAASQVEAEAGTEVGIRSWSPLRIWQAVVAAVASAWPNLDTDSTDDFTAAGVTYENLSANGDIGTGAAQVAQGDHSHSGIYEPADGTILKQADVDDTPADGETTWPVSSNWAYDHNADVTTKHLPAQAGQNGRFLTTNGSVASWGTVSAELVNDTTPQLGGNLELNGWSFVINPAPTDNTAHGVVISDTIAETVAQCDSLFLHSDGKWYQTDSNIEAEVKALQGMATADGTGEHTANVLLNGICKNTTALAFATIGAVLYAPETVGPPTTTIPADTGDFVRVIGWVINADTIYFNPSPDYLER